jgi:hypothetical protein
MKIETQIEKFRVFDILNYWRIRLWKDLYQGCIRVRFTDFRLEEHKVYNVGESTRHIDWKLFARTDRLYTKLKKKLICVAISLLITLINALTGKNKSKFSRK